MAPPPQPPDSPPLFSTTYTLHRISPFHSFPSLTSSSQLSAHAKPLLNLLRGDTLRGVQVALSNDDATQLTRAGPLKKVTCTSLPSWQDDNADHLAGVHISLIHENTTYTALLLHDPATPVDAESEFTKLPLLLTRCPKSHLSTLIHYLQTTFDCLALPLPLDDPTLRRCLEIYLNSNQGSAGGRDLVLTFSPKTKTPDQALRTITLSIDKKDVPRFWKRGGFWAACQQWGVEAMGVDIDKLLLVKTAIGGFVCAVGSGEMGAGKVKFFEAPEGAAREKKAVEEVVRIFQEKAAERY